MLSSAVTASDIEETQVNVENDIDESVILLSDIIMANEGTYTDLADEIGNGGNITLKKSVYTYDNGSAIEINTSGVIDGKGALIDMANSSIEVFDIIADGVVVKNLNFINLNANSFGCAMMFWNSGTVQNCSFSNCRSYGGCAIYIYETGLVENCNFLNNCFGGNAVSISRGTIRNCNFTRNVGYEGAAASVYSGTIENCNFDHNQAKRDGGAVWIHEGTVKNCYFNRNYADHDGGAIFTDEATIDNCNFIWNQACNYGGAVGVGIKSNIINSNFEMNGAFNGGALWMVDGTVDACSFKYDGTSNYGGAAYMQSGTVKNSNFDGDKAFLDGDGIYFYEDFVVKNCHFSNIDSERAIGYYFDSGIIEDCTFD